MFSPRLIFIVFCLISSLTNASKSPVTEQEFILLKKEFNSLGYVVSEFGTPHLTIWDKSELPLGGISSTDEQYSDTLEALKREVGAQLYIETDKAYVSSCYENYKGRDKTHLCVSFFRNRDINVYMFFPPKEEAVFKKIVKLINDALEGE